MATTWNPADKTANVSLSLDDLVATTTSSAQGGVRATTPIPESKVYAEFLLEVAAGTNCMIGLASDSYNLTYPLGVDFNSIGLSITDAFGAVINGGATVGHVEYPGTPLLTLRVAYDQPNGHIWFAYDAGPWNGDPTADPATGTGWIHAALNTFPLARNYYFAFCSNSTGASVYACFGATSFGYPVPDGFAGLDDNAQNYMAASKMLGDTLLAPPADALSTSKMLGDAALWPPTASESTSKLLGDATLWPPTLAASTSKLLAYAILVPAVPQSADIVEAVAAVDAYSAAVGIPVGLTESAGAADTYSAALGVRAAISESVDAVDTYTAAVTPSHKPLWITLDAEAGDSVYPL